MTAQVFQFPYVEDRSKLQKYEFIAGPLRMEIEAEDHTRAFQKANIKLGPNVPAGGWIVNGINAYRWVEISE